MPEITIKGGETFEVEEGKRLVLAIEDSGFDILHRCGGWAKCTTCRVVFEHGEPDSMTQAELKKLNEKELVGEVRLSCQILCTHHMTVSPVYRLSESDYEDPGKRPEDQITPDPEWTTRP